MVTATRRLEWDAAHRVMRHESKCATLHGHRYAAEIEVVAHHGGLDALGRVIDFGAIKELVGAFIDEHWDHTTMVNQEDLDLIAFCAKDAVAGKRRPYVIAGEPTAERIAIELGRVASELLAPRGIAVTRVRIWETPSCFAEWKP